MKNEITVRPYKSTNFKILKEFMEKLQDYLAGIDPVKSILKSNKEYGEVYTKDLLRQIKENNGIIYFAHYKNKPAGCIAGSYKKPTKIEKLSNIEGTKGTILDLYVEPEYRNKKIGRILILKLEEYFKKNGCELSEVGVFYPNTNAHAFYKKGGYDERMYYMIKKL